MLVSVLISLKIIETYERVGVEILRLIGFSESDANQRMKEILRFETDLAEIIRESCFPLNNSAKRQSILL